MQQANPFDLKRIAQLALYVVVRPAEYFRTMPRTGSLAEPLVFAAVLAVVSALIGTVITLISGSQGIPLSDILFTIPLVTIGAAFFVAGMLTLLWKLLGSKQNYATALRCTTATLAINPITTLLMVFPYVGIVVGFFWTMYLLIVASVEVHGISKRKATIAFSILGALMTASAMFTMASGDLLIQQLEQIGVTADEFSQMSSDEKRQTLERLRTTTGSAL